MSASGTQRVGNDEIGHVYLVVKPTVQTAPAAVRAAPEILSRAEIARRRMATEPKPPAPKRPGWPKGKKRK